MGGFGLSVLAIVVSSLREATAMKRWPVAQGRVLSAKVEKHRQVLLYEYEVAEKPFVASGSRKVRGWIEGCRSLQRRWWSVIGAGARWRCATTRNGRTNQCWNRGCLEAGSSERRSVSPCWCWRPTFIIQASKAPAVASSDTARSATGGFWGNASAKFAWKSGAAFRSRDKA
jgi:hypothetical protein